MALFLEEVPLNTHYSFRSKIDVLPHIIVPWHYHPEFELIYIEKSQGTLIVGDCIDKFTDGDMIFLGPNIPHVMKNEDSYYTKNPNLFVTAKVIHFKKEILGDRLLDLPEFHKLKFFLKNSTRGFRIHGKTKLRMVELFENLHDSKGPERIILLLQLLNVLSNSEDLSNLASEAFVESFKHSSNQKLYQIYEYVSKNFQQKIDLEAAAKVAHLSKTAFCRFIKSKTNKTFTEFLNEMRINYAIKLLVEGKLSMAQIAYECGFNSPSYFNKQFKSHTGLTPQEVKKQS
ncbi:AraC family transcriptional regulator [Ancylomarina euxinus]|uniref:AraC family transcriptional regulator n=1 Tax=Ancylomarina euxinus TaxID=2283627 RepID=A0A425Y5Y3_9BACT|nr:AraC family transcriptional regulator [Ancylomarina euxinus]MCZ4694331.1 AraC family transcriptional regulator [Ancylomarina euxinus]MUP14338.1 helix-turn-helix domain-containing protein [Ancylomarina euxinus]RRG23651.1 AraC family transcriptional regulator [Ancylomarina euxinus]